MAIISSGGSIHGKSRLLSAVSANTLDRFKPETVRASLGDEILPPYEPIKHLYFPTTAVIAVFGTMENGKTAGLGIAGSEGAAGLVALSGSDSTPYGKCIQTPGELIRVPRGIAVREFDDNSEFRNAILRFVKQFAHQIAQTSLCNCWHNIDHRFMRWLLLSHDRIEGDVLPFTHQFIALMLGSSRVRVTQAAQRLQALGYIDYVRGKLTIADRGALEANACECYDVIRRVYEKM